MKNMNMTISNKLALRFGAWGSDGKLKYLNTVIAVRDLEDASDKWCDYRAVRGFGSSDAPVVVVVDTETGEHVAKISYNGRAWDINGEEIPLHGMKTVAQCKAAGWR